jgi:hypothetical protein
LPFGRGSAPQVVIDLPKRAALASRDSTFFIGASLNTGDDLAVPCDTIGERGAAQHYERPPCDFFHRLCLDMQLVVTRRAFVTLERPVRTVNRMLGHPTGNADLALDQAALKRDIA